MNGETYYERRMSDVKCVELGEKIGFKKGYEQAKKDFERPHGEWIPVDEIGNVVRCSQCSFRTCADVAEEEYNFCPNCGADMRPKEGDAE